jgi:hypothetical protein
MANQGNNPNKGNQKGGQQSGRQTDQEPTKQGDKEDQAAATGTGIPGNKGQGEKFDSGKQTHR